jgi:hypothetical protein
MPREYKKFTIDDYEITRDGEVINKHTGKHLKPQKNGKGYYRVRIGKKLMFVHRLVAEKYVPNPDNKPQVNHIDGNKLNNSADNLEWVTNQENRNHALENGLHLCGEKCPWSKLTKEQVEFIRNHKELDSTELAILFNVSDRNIRDIRRYKSWKY